MPNTYTTTLIKYGGCYRHKAMIWPCSTALRVQGRVWSAVFKFYYVYSFKYSFFPVSLGQLWPGRPLDLLLQVSSCVPELLGSRGHSSNIEPDFVKCKFILLLSETIKPAIASFTGPRHFSLFAARQRRMEGSEGP